ncbi:MAG TPA: flavodoxin [Terriglobales bacterium]|nr:flavodoxin [Terriglobales bacterium]
MKKIAVVYWSGTGNTEAMAKSVAQGAKKAGAEASLFTAAKFSAGMAADFDAFAFGCPSMGSEQLEEGEFEPMFSSVEGRLAGKPVALFGSYGWGDGQWMRDWQARCEEGGMAVVGGEGLAVNEAPDAPALATCEALGGALAG